ncbi:pol polyprotein [Tanacetum coccineum]
MLVVSGLAKFMRDLDMVFGVAGANNDINVLDNSSLFDDLLDDKAPVAPMTNTIVTTPVNVTGALVTNTVANHAEKPEKFSGQNFKRWQQKMFFYLTTLNLARLLNETAPQVEPPKEGQPSNAQAMKAVEA